jgi:hypothetical protein
MTRSFCTFVIALSFAVVSVACGGNSGTYVTGTWKRPDHAIPKFKKIGVVALTDDPIRREIAENSLVRALTKHGITAQNTLEILEFDDQNKTQEELRAIVEGAGLDGVISIRLKHAEMESLHRGGTEPIAVSQSYYYDGFYVYYPMVVGDLYTGDDIDKKYHVEANLYQIGTGVVFSVATVIVNPVSFYEIIDEYTDQIIERMSAENALTK